MPVNPPANTPATSTPVDMTDFPKNLTSEQKAQAAAFVLSNPDMEIPNAPTFSDVIEMAKPGFAEAVERFQNNEPAKFAQLFGQVGGLGGALLGWGVGQLVGSDRGAWASLAVGTAIGQYPPAIVGHVIDRIVD